MTIKIDWDNYVVIEAEDFTQEEFYEVMEDINEEMRYHMDLGIDSFPLEEMRDTVMNLRDSTVNEGGRQ